MKLSELSAVIFPLIGFLLAGQIICYGWWMMGNGWQWYAGDDVFIRSCVFMVYMALSGAGAAVGYSVYEGVKND